MRLRRSKLPLLAQTHGVGLASSRGALRRSDMEAYDSVLAELRGAQVALVTGDPDRKGAVATAIATAASAAGQRAALVECDLASPQLAQYLGLAPSPGLHEYLRWDAEARQILQALVLAGPGSAEAQEPLVCVVAGEPTSSGAVLLSAESFRHATARLRGAYDLVVFDGPPLEEAILTELVAAQCDVALAAVGKPTASGRAGRKLRRALRRLPTRPAGLVLHEMPEPQPQTG